MGLEPILLRGDIVTFPRLAMIFSYGISVEIWERQGLLDRERIIYEELVKREVYEEVLWFTYGSNDLKYRDKLAEVGIYVVPMPRLFNSSPGRFLYSFLMPIVRWNYFYFCAVVKTNQMIGAWTGVFVKWIFKIPFMARTGYTWSRVVKQQKTKWVLDYFAEIVERFVYKNCDMAIVTTQSQAEYIREMYFKKGGV